jgi:hypothetical protein
MPRCCVPVLSCPYPFRFSRQAGEPSLLLLSFLFSCLSLTPPLLSIPLFLLSFCWQLSLSVPTSPHSPSFFVSCLVRFFASSRQFPLSEFTSDVPGFTKCLQSSFPPASCTPFSQHQCIRCCGQHYQLQYLCHWSHRRILKSVSVPPSARDIAF